MSSAALSHHSSHELPPSSESSVAVVGCGVLKQNQSNNLSFSMVYISSPVEALLARSISE